MSAFPSLPLFTDAFIADTGHLSAEQTGAYLLLIMMAWRSPGCRLPDDDVKLARWARVDARRWRAIKPVVLAFWKLSDGYYTQKRLCKEYKFVSKRKYKRRVNTQNEPLAPHKSLKNNKVDSPPNPNPNPNRKKEREDARARVKKYGKGKGNGLCNALDQLEQSIADDHRRIAEAERRDQNRRVNVVPMLSDRRRK